MATRSAIGRYHKETNYQTVLNASHDKIKQNLKRENLQQNAKDLQNILYDIKRTAHILGKEPQDVVTQEIYNQYEKVIIETMNIQNLSRTHKLTSPRQLFRRQSRTTTVAESDNIFEEELAALMTSIEQLSTKNPINIHLVGNRGADTAAVQELTEKDTKNVIEAINKLEYKKEGIYKTKNLQVNRSQKIDVLGYESTFTVSQDLPDLQSFVNLMKDATFSAKQYKSRRGSGNISPSEIGLKLGQTNIYKALTGSLSEVYSSTRDQRDIFYHGMQIMTGPLKKTPSASPNFVELHFSHLRFVYELRGTGLIDNTTGKSGVVKYLIYNDPDSDNIFVKDTASIILENLEDRSSNLFGAIYLSASKVKS